MIIIFIRIVVCGGQAMTNWQIVDARNLGFYMTDEDRDGARFAECKAIPSVWKILKLIALLTAEDCVPCPRGDGPGGVPPCVRVGGEGLVSAQRERLEQPSHADQPEGTCTIGS